MCGIQVILEIAKNQEVQLEEEKLLLQPYNYICELPSKHTNAKIARAFNHWLRISEDRLQLIVEILQLLHNSSLLIDDIQDNSILRRGILVAHSVFGISNTINAGCYGYFLALDKIKLLNHPKAANIYIEQLLEMHRGQGFEIYWRDTCTVPTETDYKLMAMRKTGTLFTLSVRLMQLFSSSQKDFSKLTSLLGLYYQILNDFHDLTKKEYINNKDFCEDITQGTFSFPIIHSIRNMKDKQLLQILRRRTDDIELKKYCISLLEKNGSLAYTKSTMQTLHTQIQEEIRSLGDNRPMENLLNDFLLSWKLDDEKVSRDP